MSARERPPTTPAHATTPMHQVTSSAEIDDAFRAPVALLFKHSTACAISAMADREVRRFAAARPDVPVYVVDVHAQRGISDELARALDILHHSPQAILLRDGVAVWHASHFAITRAGVESRLGEPGGAPADAGRAAGSS